VFGLDTAVAVFGMAALVVVWRRARRHAADEPPVPVPA
jgi:hypothetical protein